MAWNFEETTLVRKSVFNIGRNVYLFFFHRALHSCVDPQTNCQLDHTETRLKVFLSNQLKGFEGIQPRISL